VLGRPAGSTWEVATVIHQFNPDAFISNNPNLVKLGSVLRIPAIEELLGQIPVTSRPNPVAVNDATINAPVVEQVVDTLIEKSIAPLANKIVLEQSLIEPELPEVDGLAVVNSDEVKVVVQETPAPVPALISNDTQLSADESEIFVDRNLLENLQDPQVIPPIADSEIRKLEEFISDTPAVKVDTAPAQDKIPVKVHPLLAVGLGLLLGCIIAALMLGRRFLSGFVSGQAEQLSADAQDNQNLATDLSASANLKEVDFGEATDVVEDYSEPVANTHTAAVDSGTDISESETISLDAGASTNHNVNAEIDKETNDSPRISLHDIDSTLAEETPLEKTERFSSPDFSSEDVELVSDASELKGTATMRELFSEEAENFRDETSQADDDFTVTKELPDLGDATDLEATSDLQSLTNDVESDTANDRLSATLSEALGLLEQDYEEEYSESKMLEQREIREAFAEQTSKKS
jgi:hypothetical protein